MSVAPLTAAAYHEAGHAIFAVLGDYDVSAVTIAPDGSGRTHAAGRVPCFSAREFAIHALYCTAGVAGELVARGRRRRLFGLEMQQVEDYRCLSRLCERAGIVPNGEIETHVTRAALAFFWEPAPQRTLGLIAARLLEAGSIDGAELKEIVLEASFELITTLSPHMDRVERAAGRRGWLLGSKLQQQRRK